ncbi:hemerythrin domain-containing protein (plasmid) [Aminobacter sp. SR38]|jgi:hemerythrin-like domain-containing protein|uniref:hemerythrin domain-containing protein n=1 Tax=Aminobacter sp. SR38 TaxID=2774562 RepID=UPI001786AAED|nr:hemerythrin domain-containing protein [Aminobacter sp. SR38]QOF75589.1 hemerythrin domain-containing protein [Aminobacter sp. SR38]
MSKLKSGCPRWLAELNRRHSRLLMLCDMLEDIADSLPRHVTPALCRTVATSLKPELDRVCEIEERFCFPYLTGLTEAHASSETLCRMSREHEGDRAAAEEVVRTLAKLARGRKDVNWDATGYMLRSFFVGVRRHVANEQCMLGFIGTQDSRH